METHLIYEDGRRVYPCWCGETHRGEWAAEDWRHHNCDHRIIVDLGNEQGICEACGFSVVILRCSETLDKVQP